MYRVTHRGAEPATGWIVALFTLVLAVALAVPAAAQQAISSGTITGVVHDAEGLAVPGVTIEAVNEQTRQTRATVSNSTGTFNIPALQPSRYTLRVKLTGFKTVEQVGIQLRTNEVFNAGTIALVVAQVAETVTVSAAVAGVETATAVRTEVIDQSTIESLVSRGRDPVRLLNALPGVDPSIGGTINGATIGTALPTMQGTAGFNTYVAIDGVGSADGDTGNNNGMTSIDAIQEIRVVTNSYSAEYGRNSGPQINIVTKTGTRKYAGTLSTYIRHEALNSNTLTNKRLGLAKPIARFYTGVVTLGGPVGIPRKSKLNQTFFFFTHEQWSTKSASSPNTKQMPTVAERAGDFSQTTQTTGAPFFIRDPLLAGPCSSTTGGPACFPGNVIPPGRINPIGLALLNLFPKPNFFDVSVSNRQYNFQDTDIPNVYRRLDQVTIDRNLTTNDRLQVKYRNWRPNRESTTGTFGINSNWNQYRAQYAQKEDAITINHTHTISSRLVNEASFGYRRTPEVAPIDTMPDPISKLQRTPNGLGSLGQLFHGAALNPLDLLPGLAFTGVPGTAPSVGYDGRFPIDAIDLRWSYQDNLSWTTGRHLLKVGAYYEYNINSEGFSANCFSGCLDFTSTGTTAAQNPFNTNHPYANALLGYYTTYTESNTRPFRGANQWQAEWFAQDSYKVHSTLTLELGMRFARGAQWHLRKQGWKGVNPPAGQRAAAWLTDAYTPAKNPRLYVPACAPPATTCAATARLAKDPVTGAILPNSVALIGALVPGSGDFYNGMVLDNDPQSFDGSFVANPGVQAQPRLGFAWNVNGKGRTSVRGGWGITEQLFDNSSVFANTFPLQVPIRQQPTLFYGNMSDLAGTPAFNSPSAVVGWDPNEDRVQKTYNYSIEIQQNVGLKTVVTAAYVANRQRNLTTTRDINQVPVGARFAAANADPTSSTAAALADAFLRPIPQYTSVTVRTRDGLINYQSLQVTANRRLNNGIAAGLAYTLGKTRGMTGTLTSVLDPRTRNYGYITGNSGDRRHILSLNWLWNLPNGSRIWNTAITRGALDGWQLAGVGFVRSGLPALVTYTTTDAGGTDTMGGGDPVRITIVSGCNPLLSGSDQTETRYFNTSCFIRTPRGEWGTNQPIVRQPGNKNLDLSLSKSFHMGTKAIQVRADAYNALSVTTRTVTTAAQFDAAGRQVNSDFGRLALPTDEARQVEISLKWIF